MKSHCGALGIKGRFNLMEFGEFKKKTDGPFNSEHLSHQWIGYVSRGQKLFSFQLETFNALLTLINFFLSRIFQVETNK